MEPGDFGERRQRRLEKDQLIGPAAVPRIAVSGPAAETNRKRCRRMIPGTRVSKVQLARGA